jgi:YD repeat-containing protein
VPIENPGLDSFAFAMVGRSSMLVSAMAKSAPMAPMAAMSVTTVATTSFSGETGLNGFSSGIARDDYEYDSSGRLIAVYHNVAAFGAAEPTTKGGQVAAMTFDALGRMTRQTDFTGPGSTQVAVDRMMTYDLAGRVTADTTRTRQNDGQGNGLLVDNISTTTYDAIGTVLSVGTQTNRYRNANAYSGWIGGGQGAVWGTNTSSTTTYTYEWYQGAVQTGITYKEGSATRLTTFTMANIAGQMVTKSVLVNDGRPRTVTFDTDVSGQVIRRRESDNNYSQGDPSAMWYRFAGRQMGMITNNGGWEGSYAASVAQRQAAPATTAPGAFANGATVGKQEEQFSSNLEVINSYSQGSVAGSYVVRSGDSLQGIAQNLWGDSGLWYKLAEANGLSGAASLFEGQTLRLPAGVMRNTYNASSVTPYNPAETLGDVTPSTVSIRRGPHTGEV